MVSFIGGQKLKLKAFHVSVSQFSAQTAVIREQRYSEVDEESVTVGVIGAMRSRELNKRAPEL